MIRAAVMASHMSARTDAVLGEADGIGTAAVQGRRDARDLRAHREQADRNFPGTLGAIIVTFDPKIPRVADLALN